MSRVFWTAFFMVWPVAAIALCWVAPEYGWWFPGVAETAIGRRMDHLFEVILWITGVVFVGTHLALGYALWTGLKKTDQPALHTHGNHLLELIWTGVPAVVLLFIAFYQMDVWNDYAITSSIPEGTVAVAEVNARQYEWRVRYPYPGEDMTKQDLRTDLWTVNELFVPANESVLVRLRTMDVQHSFFVPEMRLKKDALPGYVIPIWFTALEPGEYDWTCTELCGWGHYKMKARVVALPTQEYAAKMQQLADAQFEDGYRPARLPIGSTADSP